ncbi:hypothetical protein SDC9_103115 [bioreactor metagenome]|uniref:Uncharacterized protein n=1 Tax=bioreactor metagenome TaxID=1076179 RepID=A0A645AZI2_9ZZZZ
MGDLHKSLARRAADPVRRGIRRYQLGMFFFYILQFAHEPVILKIRNLRRVLLVIEPRVAFKLAAQLLRSLFQIFEIAHSVFSSFVLTV